MPLPLEVGWYGSSRGLFLPFGDASWKRRKAVLRRNVFDAYHLKEYGMCYSRDTHHYY